MLIRSIANKEGTMLTAKQLREKVTEWVQYDLSILNDNGKHWIQGAYRRHREDYTAMCMMGGLGKTLIDQLKVALPADALGQVQDLDEVYDEHDGDLVGWTSDLDEEYSAPLGLDLNELSKEAREAIKEHAQIWDATEVAMAWASWIHNVEKRPALFVSSEYVARDGGDEGHYKMAVGESPSYIIINANDADGTEWEDIVKIHEMAVAGLKDGSCPLTWEDASTSLIENMPQTLRDRWNPKTASFTRVPEDDSNII